MIIRIDIEAETQEEYQEAIRTLAAGLQQESIDVAVEAPTVAKKTAKKQKAVSTDSTSDTEPSKTGEQPEPTKKEPAIEPETATKTRYFLHKPNNKTFVIKKGEGIPVEAVHYGDAIEMTKAEYDKFNGKEPVEESKAVTKKDVQQLMQEAQKSGKLSLVKDVFGQFGATKLSELQESDYVAFTDELGKLLKGYDG